MNQRNRRFKIYREKAKDRHVSHWDWDYVSTAEVENAYAKAKSGNEKKFWPNFRKLVGTLLRRRFGWHQTVKTESHAKDHQQ